MLPQRPCSMEAGPQKVLNLNVGTGQLYTLKWGLGQVTFCPPVGLRTGPSGARVMGPP